MNRKKLTRQRRARKTRIRIKEIAVPRLCIFRTPKHIYAQVLNSMGNEVLACASTVEKSVKETATTEKGKLHLATTIGKLVATRAREKGIEKVAFDRSGFKYHGRVKALADGARDGGLVF